MLLIASCYFYMAFIPVYILILLVTIIIDYFAGILIEKTLDAKRKKIILIISIVSTCFVLFIFKYYNFFINNFNGIADLLDWNYSINGLKIILPIGLSFHTFQSLSYVIEVYRGQQKAEKNFGIYSLYVMYYPQLVAGPIERPQNLLHQFHKKTIFSYQKTIDGLKLMVWGFFLKLVIADRAAIYVDTVYNNISQHDGMTFIAATILFSFQVYSDFAGYSLIAIGASRTMGIELMQNFNRPYFARSIQDFWKRWHISLSTWFRDYVYLPLSFVISWRVKSNRFLFKKKDLFIYIVASTITWFLTGLWHGANYTFVLWGLIHGFFLIIYQWQRNPRKTLFRKLGIRNDNLIVITIETIITLIIVNFAWIFFRANTISDAFSILRDIFSFPGNLFIPEGDDVVVPVYSAIAIIILIFVELKKEYFDFLFSFSQNKYEIVRILYFSFLIFLILYLGVFDGGQFIYFQF